MNLKMMFKINPPVTLSILHFYSKYLVLLVLTMSRAALPVVISEIMPNWRESRGAGEWIELVNESSVEVNLAGFKFIDFYGNLSVIKNAESSLPPGAYAVIARDSLTVDDLAIDDSVRFIVLDDFISLNNDGDTIELRDAQHLLVDRVVYGSEASRVSGRSWERIDLNQSGEESANWGPCANLNGHTAGRPNSLKKLDDVDRIEITISPNPFSPDGDGSEDFTIITFKLPFASSRITVDVFDSAARRVRRLTSNMPAGADQPQIAWDGLDAGGRRLPVGRYVVYIEALDYRSGKRLAGKCTVVIAGKLK